MKCQTTAKLNCDSSIYCGETINFSIESDNINLEDTEFIIYLYDSTKIPRIFRKEESEYRDGDYIFTITAEQSAEMAPTSYTLEIMLEQTNVCIGRILNFITLRDSLIKQEL